MNGTLDVSAQVLPQLDVVSVLMWGAFILIALAVFAGIAWTIFQMWN